MAIKRLGGRFVFAWRQALSGFCSAPMPAKKAGASDRGIRLKSKRKLKSPFSEVKFGFSKDEFGRNSARKSR